MRRLVLLVFALLVAVGAGAFLFMNADRIERAISGPSARYVVATRDIPAFERIPRDALGLRTIERGRPAPPGAIVDVSDAAEPEVLNLVAGRASPQAIAGGEAIRFQDLAPFEMLQGMRGRLVLLAKVPLREGEQLEPWKFRTVFLEAAAIPPGAVTGWVGEDPAKIIDRLPPAWIRRAVEAEQPLVFSALTFEVPAERRTAQPLEPLPADGSVPQAPVEEILRRLSVTPEAARVGVGRRAESEVQAVAGYDGPVDVFLSPARSAMRARGVEEHRRVIRGARLSVYQGYGPGNDGALMWVMTDAETAARIAALRRQGALVTVVPRGAPLPSEAGVPVLCTTAEVCYRSLTEADEAPSGSAPDAVVPEVPVLPTGPDAARGGGPWQGPPAVVR